MFLDLQNVPVEGQKVDRSLSAEGFPLDGSDFRLTGPVEIDARLVRVEDDEFRLRGRLHAAIELSCVRCLESVPMEVDEELDLLYLPQSRNVAPGGEGPENERGLGDDEMSVSFYRDDRIDLAHLVIEQIVLALPMKPLCREDCAGLCAACGANRNVDRCECTDDNTDPRWSGLKSLLG